MQNMAENLWMPWGKALLTSIIVWDKDYIPRQVIIIAQKHKQGAQAIVYYMLGGLLCKHDVTITKQRTKRQQETDFHLFCEIKRMIDLDIRSTRDDNLDSTTDEGDENIRSLIEELFISELGMALLLDHDPEFGFYSLSPNIKKISKMIHGEPYRILDWLKSKKLIP
jgi:hypothetical protein